MTGIVGRNWNTFYRAAGILRDVRVVENGVRPTFSSRTTPPWLMQVMGSRHLPDVFSSPCGAAGASPWRHAQAEVVPARGAAAHRGAAAGGGAGAAPRHAGGAPRPGPPEIGPPRGPRRRPAGRGGPSGGGGAPRRR